MLRWVFAAAILTLAVALPVAPAQGGWFSSHGGCHDECAPSCAAPVDCYTAPSCYAPQACAPVAPTCCAPQACAPVAPTCCAPAAPSCACPSDCYGHAPGCCDSGYGHCEDECCVRRGFRRLMDLERRKNACLKRTFLGWMDRGDHCGHGCHGHADCAPNYYYQPGCSVPHGAY